VQQFGKEVGAPGLRFAEAETGRNAIERQEGRCYTPAALKVFVGRVYNLP
jgi:hypothetical protein